MRIERHPSIHFITLGCAKNEVDTNRMRALIEASELFDIEEDVTKADLVIINTCSFLTEAVNEGIELTLELAQEKAENQINCPIVMAGCIPSRYGSELIPELPEVAAFVPVDKEDTIVQVCLEVLQIEYSGNLKQPKVARTVEAACAYIKISDGCDRFCSFCAIPYIRGRYYSRSPREILDESAYLVDQGVKELVLIGQDTGIWGSDLEPPLNLAWLLREVAKIARKVNGWVRVLYLQPEGMTQDLIETIRDTPEVCKYIDIPLQHVSEEILKRMNRRGNAREFLELIQHLRAEIPNITLRTTYMVGFPGETEEDFEELVSFAEEAQFDYHALFSYSPEEGTEACELPNQVEEDIKLERLQKMTDICDSLGYASAAQHIGKTYPVLVDGLEEEEDGLTTIIGRCSFQAPDSDGVVHIEQGSAVSGETVYVTITDSACYELFGDIVQREV